MRTNFLRNRSAQGGGLYNADETTVNVTDCEFTGNTARQGGAVFRVNGTINLVRASFSNNTPGNVL